MECDKAYLTVGTVLHNGPHTEETQCPSTDVRTGADPSREEPPMIYELRTYTLIPGKQGEYLKLNAEVGVPRAARNMARSRARGQRSSAR